jgi:hypothetical protein
MFEFTVDPARRRITAQLAGDLSVTELLEALDRICAHPDFDPSYEAMVDGLGITKMPPIYELREVALAIKRMATAAGARRAIITRSESFYMMAKLFAIMTLGAASRYRVFLDVNEAEAWLAGEGPDEE